MTDRTGHRALSPGLTGCPRLLNIRTLIAVIGLTLTALTLTGSTEKPAISSRSIPDSTLSAEIRRRNDLGRERYSAGRYLEARAIFLSAAALAERAGDPRAAAMNWNNAGGSALARMDFRDALADLMKAREIAQASRKYVPLAMAMNNLASLYLQMSNPAAAIQIAREALAGPAANAGPGIRPKLRIQLALALGKSNRFQEADPIYRAAVEELEEQEDFDSSARILAMWGSDALEAHRLDEAESTLSRALWLVRMHHLTASANVLRGLAQLKNRQGDLRSAAALFDAAVDLPQSLTPRWLIYADRAQFRLDRGDLRGSLDDFREAHRLADLMRADIVPVDQDRVALENGLSRIAEGLVETGNRLARRGADRRLLRETFDTAEQDRLWSLRTLVPEANDWRTRLPESYWDLLARYQSTRRALLAQPSPELRKQASALQLQLEEIEAAASSGRETNRAQSALAHVRAVLDAGSVLFSFSVMKTGGWLWAVDRTGADVYAIPRLDDLRSRVTEFARAIRDSDPRAAALGAQLYRDLFGAVPASYRNHPRWLLELDGPLFDLPFGALVAGIRKNEPIYLVERASLETIPGALMLQSPAPGSLGSGEFLGIGDPIYNAADPRYTGAKKQRPDILLPRLLSTGPELQACARVWGPARSIILTGRNADLASVTEALETNPAVIHFATHVVTAPVDHASGLIALSLDLSGAMGLLGPAEIVAHPVSTALVVLNGCHSAQGETLPASGLMGLTRAWIGAGARSVLATRWDIADEAGRILTIAFYRALRAHPERGPALALQQAQLAVLKDETMQHSRNNAAIWAAYFLFGRG